MRKGSSFLTPTASSTTVNAGDGFSTAKEEQLFPKVDPAVDGEDCDHDCASCSVKYPAKFSIDEDEKLYGHVKGWSTHILVATGKTDWVRDVADEKGSVMEAVDKAPKPVNGVCCFIHVARADFTHDVHILCKRPADSNVAWLTSSLV